MYFEIQTSRARRTFKRSLGQTNHYLITLLIGLDYIENNAVELSPSFSTSWNPRDKTSSVFRSREFAIKATLAWTVDALDTYLTLCHQRPTLYQNKALNDAAGAAGRSVLEKFDVLRQFVSPSAEYNNIDALTEVAIQWRNNLVHSSAQNMVGTEARGRLAANTGFFEKEFRSLNIQELLAQFDAKKPPRFKEVASLVSCVQRFVQLSDSYLIANADSELHLIDCLDFHLKDRVDSTLVLSQLAQLYNLPEDRRRNSLTQSAMNYGFGFYDAPDKGQHTSVIETLSNVSLQEAIDVFEAETLDQKLNLLKAFAR